jgi:PKD repeat protein
MYFNLANISMFNSDDIQVYFSDVLVSGASNPLPFVPHIYNPAGNFPDSVNWTIVSGIYTANGTENFIIIGNFLDSTNSTAILYNASTGTNVAFAFIDDVSLVKVPCTIGVAFTASDNDICPGSCIDFTNLTAGATNFQWTFAGGTPGSSTDENPLGICYSSPGNYDVQLIASNGGGSDTVTLANYITVYPAPLPQSITQSGDTLFALQGAISYQWYMNGNAISGATDYFYVAIESGNYNVIATDNNGCEVEAVIFDVIANVPAAASEPEFSLYPNPVYSKLQIQLAAKIPYSVSSIRLVNAIGELMPVYADLSSLSLDCTSLEAGIYFLEIIVETKTFRLKFIKS